jgi:hypothetical protein
MAKPAIKDEEPSLVEIVARLPPEERARIVAEGKQRRLKQAEEEKRKQEEKAAKMALRRDEYRERAGGVFSAITERAPPRKKMGRRM